MKYGSKFFSYVSFTCTVCLIYCGLIGIVWAQDRPEVSLQGDVASITMDLAGGSISSFRFSDGGMNPFTWNSPEPGTVDPQPMGHFICFDRWGQPSSGERASGMPFHGEASRILWRQVGNTSVRGGIHEAVVECDLPMGGLTMTRTMRLHEGSSVVTVSERVKNVRPLGRMYNLVQHPSIAPPFLDESVRVDCNAWKGFMQESPMPVPEEPPLYWPGSPYRGQIADLRYLTGDPRPTVVSFIFREGVQYGWVTAYNPGEGLLVGYIWETDDYPWLNLWRNTQDGKPSARGLEFGTTGLHQPFPVLAEKGNIFNTPLFAYIDAGEEQVRSYDMFLAHVPEDLQGVGDVRYTDTGLVITEDGGDKREITPVSYTHLRAHET